MLVERDSSTDQSARMAEEKAAARSVVVGVPGIVLRNVILLMQGQGAPLHVVVWLVGGAVHSGGSVAGDCGCGGTW